jgi:hypothetical protein
MTIRTTSAIAVLTAGAALASAGLALPAPPRATVASATSLTGTLDLEPGKLASGHGRPTYTGTYFRMLLPGKTDQYFSNPDSRAKDKTYTLMRPGSDGGLALGRFQPPPNPAFSSSGDALAHRITLPEMFASIRYSISSAPVDAQSGGRVGPPALTLRGTKITGNLSAWTAEWNKIYFNQGAPKPGGSYPGLTRPVTGTFNRRTRKFTIIWYSAIVGGPFNGFTGFWHLQGVLKP